MFAMFAMIVPQYNRIKSSHMSLHVYPYITIITMTVMYSVMYSLSS